MTEKDKAEAKVTESGFTGDKPTAGEKTPYVSTSQVR